MVKLRSMPVFCSGTVSNCRSPQLAHALRRSKKVAPQLAHRWATRCGGPSPPSTRYPTIGIWAAEVVMTTPYKYSTYYHNSRAVDVTRSPVLSVLPNEPLLDGMVYHDRNRWNTYS